MVTQGAAGIIVALVVAGLLFLNSSPDLFSFQSIVSFESLEEKYGPMIKLSNMQDNNFIIENIVGGEVTFSHQQCVPEDLADTVQLPIVSINNVVVARTSVPTCEDLVFSQGDNWGDLDFDEKRDIQNTKVTTTTVFEIDPSFLGDSIFIMGAEEVTFFLKVQCTTSDQCLQEQDVLRRTRSVCDLVDYTCKAPQDVIMSSDEGEGGFSFDDTKKFDDTKNVLPIALALLVVALIFLLGKK